jgi:hypothetical protein
MSDDPVRDHLSNFENEFLNDDLPSSSSTYRQINYGDELTKAENKAKQTIKSLIEFYFEEEKISKDEYLNYKKLISEQSISQLLFLMKTGQEALIKLMQNIDSGDMSPRMFEVLANLQRSQLDIVKNYGLLLLSTEEDLRRTQFEVEAKEKEQGKLGDSKIQTSEDKLITSSTKKLLKSVEQYREEDPYQDENLKSLEEIQEEVRKNSERKKPETKKQEENDENGLFDEFDEIDEY